MTSINTTSRGHVAAIILLFVCATFISQADELSVTEREQKTAELQQLRDRIRALREELTTQQQQKHRESTRLEKIEKQIAKSARQIKKLAGQLDDKHRELKNLQQQKTQIEKRLARQRDLLARQIRTAYMIGRQEYLKLLLNQENPAVIGRTMTYYDYFHRARSHNINEALQTLTRLEEVKATIKLKTVQLEKLRDEQLQAKTSLEETYRQRSDILAALEAEIKTKDQKLQRLSEDESNLQTLLREIRVIMPSLLTETDKRETFAKKRGRLFWPVKGHVEKLFGKARQAAHISWNGVIIDSPEGREVRAVSHGRVAYADWLRGYGMLIIIDHGDGYMTLYGHNQAIFKETGDWVEEGEVIGSVGRSGGQEQSGLYFEIRHQGKPTNPVQWCRG